MLHTVVVNYNGARDTMLCVESLLASDYHPHHILVIDNGSTDDSPRQLSEWAARSGHRVMAEHELDALGAETRVVVVCAAKNSGFAGGCNLGIRLARQRAASGWILLLNSDAVIAPDAASAMIEDAKDIGNLGAMGATVLRDDTPEVVELLGGATVNRMGMVTPVGAGTSRGAPRPREVHMDYVSGTCLLTRGDIVGVVGEMDERFFLYSEDVDWGLRMSAAGLRLAYCPRAEVWHRGGASVVHRSPTHDYYMVRGALMLVQKHFPAMLPMALLHWAYRGLLPKVARREWVRLRAAARGYRDFVTSALADAPRELGRA